MDLKAELNEHQYQAATHKDGPLLILAGAGSGKTRVLTYRMAYLINECGISPYNILAITFTNKAAKEMKERVTTILGDLSKGMWISTFHAACCKILRRDAELVGYSKNFVIYDDTETNSVIKDCLKQLNYDEKVMPYKLVKNLIGRAKDKIISPDEYKELNAATDYNASKVAAVYELYQKKLKQNNAMDFDDIILYAIQLLEENQKILDYYRDRFKYIMVDEYQDTNMAQYKLISLLASTHKNLCVVGDDDQSIYSFRGADITNILNFEIEYKNCKVIKLERNYRSTQNILDAANNVIKNNNGRKDKVLWTDDDAGEKLIRYTADDHHDEANFIAKEIKMMVDMGKMSYSDFTILYRMNALSQSYESSFIRFGIPYKIFGGHKFFDRKEIKDIVAYLRVIENPVDDYAIKRIINVPKRGIGETTLGYAQDLAVREQVPLFNILINASNYPTLSRASQKMERFALQIAGILAEKEDKSVSQLVDYLLINTGIVDEYKAEKTDEAQSRIENLKEFITVAKSFEEEQQEDAEGDSSLSGFLNSVSLISDMDSTNGEINAVTMMTLHSAKGLEFPVVFLVGAEEGIFPSYRSVDNAESLEEERRLCYVGITRARKKLYITNTKSRMLFGQTSYNKECRFLKEIPDEVVFVYCENQKKLATSNVGRKTLGSDSKGMNTNPSLGSFGRVINSVDDILKTNSIAVDSFNVNDQIKHKRFGEGIITKIEGSGNDTKFEIEFESCGMKRLMATFANIEKC